MDEAGGVIPASSVISTPGQGGAFWCCFGRRYTPEDAMSNSSTSHAKVNDSSPDEPERGFRGTWVPAEIFLLVEEGEINSTEFLLLLIIDSLVKARKEGCWASNSYLANKVHVHIDHLRDMLQKLKRLKLVIEVGYIKIKNKKRRMLETQWSRVNRNTVGINPHLNERTVGISAQGADTPQYDSSTKSLSREEPIESDCCRPARATPSRSVNGVPKADLLGNPQKATCPLPEGWAHSSAMKLHEALVRAHLLHRRPRLSDWAQRFVGLRRDQMDIYSHSEEEAELSISEHLDWFIENIEGKFTPRAHSAGAFCDKYDAIMASKKRSDENDHGGDAHFDPNMYRPFTPNNW